jgi:hypothetical protein
MHGASLRSAREEIARDHVARTPMPRHGLEALVNALPIGCAKRTSSSIQIIVIFQDKGNPPYP